MQPDACTFLHETSRNRVHRCEKHDDPKQCIPGWHIHDPSECQVAHKHRGQHVYKGPG